jgi:hypothetical protein
MADKALARAKSGEPGDAAEEGDASPGSLFASGLIAAGGIMGLMGVINAYIQMQAGIKNPIGIPHGPIYNAGISVLAFAALAYALYYFARKPLKK